MTYSMDYRRAVAAAYDECGSSAEVAEQFGCCESWVRRLIQRRRQTGSLEPFQHKLPDQCTYDDISRGRGLAGQASASLHGQSHAGLAGAASKKKPTHAAEQDCIDVAAARQAWFEKFADVRVNQLVFLDEFGATTNMQRTHGRAPRGRRVVSKVPHGHWKVISTIAAMSVKGIAGSASFDGATDTELFVTFIEEGLVPALKPGQVVVMDNLPAHKTPEVDRLIESAGARVLRLPPYSPDYNPIEMAISKVKTILRSLGERDVGRLFDVIGDGLNRVTPIDAKNYIRHCGYSATP